MPAGSEASCRKRCGNIRAPQIHEFALLLRLYPGWFRAETAGDWQAEGPECGGAQTGNECQALSLLPGPEVTMPLSMRRRRYQFLSLTSM